MKIEYFKQVNDYIARREIDTADENYIRHDNDFVYICCQYEDEYCVPQFTKEKFHRYFIDLRNEVIENKKKLIVELQNEIDFLERCHSFENYWHIKFGNSDKVGS